MTDKRYREMNDAELVAAALDFQCSNRAVGRMLYAVAKRLENRQQAGTSTGYSGRCRTIEEIRTSRGLSSEALEHLFHRDGVCYSEHLPQWCETFSPGGVA